MLRLFALGASAALLAACGPATAPVAPTAAPAPAQPTSPPAPVPTVAPTSAPTPAAQSAPPAPVVAKPTSQPASAQPRPGGTLRIGVISEPPNMDGFIQLSIIRDQLWLFFDKLIDIDQNGVPQPKLATSWEMAPDFTRLKLNVRQGVKFHSGRELSSEDVKWNLDRTHDPKAGNGNLPPLFAFLKEVEAPDKNTLILNFDQAKPAAFDILNFVNIVDPQSEPKERPVGTGPFTFGEWASGDHLRLIKNPSYWDTGKPYLDEIVFQYIKDPQAMVGALEAGAIDVADPLPTTDAARLQKNQGQQVIVSSNPAAINIVGVNVVTPPFEKKQVRQALNFALDRRRMVDVALSGFAEPRVLPWPATSVAFDETRAGRYPFDLEKARELLSAAGVTAFEAELTYPTSTPEYQSMGQIFQEDLRKIGATLTLKPLEPAAWNNYVIQTKTWGLSFATAPPVNLHPSSVLSRVWTSPASNINNFRSEAWTSLAGRVAAEGEPSRLKTLSLELDDFLLDESWFIPLTSAPPKIATRANLRGVVFDANDTPTFREAWLA
ncbi:MAG TPA: ABC transporter substrate-binding protein [Reyranella sp.]|nr:ABC transporter substrate-binding protein [Reyranella sp.]